MYSTVKVPVYVLFNVYESVICRLDQNQQYVLFERSARQSLAWIKEEGVFSLFIINFIIYEESLRNKSTNVHF